MCKWSKIAADSKTAGAVLGCLAVLLGFERASAELPMGWTSARSLGMGNVATAVPDGTNAIFFNPALLMKVSGVHWTVMNPRAGIGNPSNLSLAGPLKEAGSNIGQAVNALYGHNVWLGGGALSSIAVPYFGVAAYASTEGGVEAVNPPNPRLNMNYYFDYGGAVGMALPLIPGFMGWGVTVRSVNRTGTTSAIGPGTLGTGNMTALTNQLKNRGNAYGVDFGALFTFPGPISPSLSFVYRNLGHTTFSRDEGASAPPAIAPEMIAGASLSVNLPLLSITPAIEYRYISWPNVPMGSNLGLGLELGLPLLNLRGGMSQGYYTAGAGIDLGIIQADVATWGVELGAYPGQAVDRRYMAQLTIQLGIDFGNFFGGGSKGGGSGDGSGSGGGSGRNRLKRRR
jgi:hypothetical protein